jgi:hypothetical protein
MIVIIGLLWAYSGLLEELSSTLAVAGFALALLGGSATGLIIGSIIWIRAAKIRKNPHPFERVLIGVGVLVAWSMFTSVKDLIRGREILIWIDLLYAVVIGIPAGLLARSKSNPESEEQIKSD